MYTRMQLKYCAKGLDFVFVYNLLTIPKLLKRSYSSETCVKKINKTAWEKR